MKEIRETVSCNGLIFVFRIGSAAGARLKYSEKYKNKREL